MTKLLTEALDVVRRMPAADQDAIAHAMMSLARLGATAPDDADERRDVEEALSEIARGEIANPEEIASAFRAFERGGWSSLGVPPGVSGTSRTTSARRILQRP